MNEPIWYNPAFIGACVTLLTTLALVLRQSIKVDSVSNKVNEVHILVNSNLTEISHKLDLENERANALTAKITSLELQRDAALQVASTLMPTPPPPPAEPQT